MKERGEPQKTALMGQWSFFSFAKKKTEPKNKIIIKTKIKGGIFIRGGEDSTD